MKTVLAPATAIAFLLLAGAALAQPAKTADTSKGKVLVDARGMTLYTYDRDTSGKSNCTGQCIQLWPAFLAADADTPSGDWTIIKRSDGKKQWAYKGKALYLWKDDKKPGDVTGDGVNNTWRLAVP